MLNEAQLDYLLIRQKDEIVKLCNLGQADKALAALEIVRELWLATSYEYKYLELRERCRVLMEVWASLHK